MVSALRRCHPCVWQLLDQCCHLQIKIQHLQTWGIETVMFWASEPCTRLQWNALHFQLVYAKNKQGHVNVMACLPLSLLQLQACWPMHLLEFKNSFRSAEKLLMLQDLGLWAGTLVSWLSVLYDWWPVLFFFYHDYNNLDVLNSGRVLKYCGESDFICQECMTSSRIC